MHWHIVRSSIPFFSDFNPATAPQHINSPCRRLVSAEIYMTIARLSRTFDMDLHKTTMDRVEVYHDRFVAYPKKSQDTGSWRGEIVVKVTGKSNLKITA